MFHLGLISQTFNSCTHTHTRTPKGRDFAKCHILVEMVLLVLQFQAWTFLSIKRIKFSKCAHTHTAHPYSSQEQDLFFLFIYLFFMSESISLQWLEVDLELSVLQNSVHFKWPGVFFRLCSTIKRQGKIQSPYVCNKHVCCVSVALVLLLGGLVTGI